MALAICEAITFTPTKALLASLLQKANGYFNREKMISLILAILAVNDWIYR